MVKAQNFGQQAALILNLVELIELDSGARALKLDPGVLSLLMLQVTGALVHRTNSIIQYLLRNNQINIIISILPKCTEGSRGKRTLLSYSKTTIINNSNKPTNNTTKPTNAPPTLPTPSFI